VFGVVLVAAGVFLASGILRKFDAAAKPIEWRRASTVALGGMRDKSVGSIGSVGKSQKFPEISQ
jgi:hypothetical protein